MYECLKYHCPNCGRTSQCLSQYQTSNSATERHESKLSLHECSCNKKFLKSQKWRRRYKKLFSLTSIPDGILFTFAHIIHFPSWMLILSIALLLVCCQGNHVQPAPTTAGSELHDVMVPVGTAFYYKIPDSAFHCDVEHLMVTGSNDRFLPGWLTYDSIERKLYGIPLNSDVGTNSFLLVAIVKGELNRGQICGSKTFEITVPPESDAVPIQLMSAALQSASIGEDGTVQFDNPNLHHRIVCFPGVHVTFASVIVNTDLNQLNGHQRIHILQHLALHLGLSVNKISTFSEQFPHPLISGLELPSVIAAGAGNGRFAKGIKTVFTWALGCGAIKVNETLITYLTKTSQDGTFSDKINHSIFGWHITSGIQKTLPKIRVRRAPLIGTHTPTTTVAMPTAVSVSRTTVFYNVSVSLSRVLPSASFSVTLAPINSSLPLPARTLSTAESSVEYISTMTSSASPPDVQTHTTLDIISSIMINTTNIASQVSTATSVASLTLSPSTLPVSQNILSPSRSASFETASLSRTPRISSVMDEITTSLIEPVSTIGPIVSASSAKTLEQSVDPMSSRAFSQTVQISSSASYTVELSTLQPTTVYQTSSIDLSSLKPSFISSGPIVSDTSLYSSPKTLEQTVHPTSSRSLNQTVQLSSGASYSVEPSTFLFATVYQTSLIDLTSLKPSFISSGPIVSDTSLHSSPKTLEESVHPTSSKALNQTIQISNDASYTVEPSTFLFTTVHQTSLIDLTSLKPSFISSTSIVSDTSLHSSPKTLKQSVLPTSGALNQTIQISSNASYSVEPSTFFSTTVYQTSLIDVTSLKPGSISSVPPSLTSTRTIYVSLTSSSEFISPSSNGTIEYETSSSFVASPGSSASSTSFTNQTGSSQSDAIILVSSSKATYIAMTPVLDTRSITQVIQPSSSVLLHQTKSSAFIPDLNSTESFTSTQPFNLTSSVTMTKSSEEVETTAVTPSSPLNSTDVFIPRTSSTAVYQPNKTDATLTTIETRSPTFMPQATTTVVTMPTRQNISSLQVSSTVPIAESISLMSSRVLVTVSHTESQVLSASLSNSTHIRASESTVIQSHTSSVEPIESLSVSPTLNKTTIALATESPVSKIQSPFASSTAISKTQDQLTRTIVSSSSVSSAIISKTEDLASSISASSSLVSSATISKTDDVSTSINASNPLVSSIGISKTDDLSTSINASSPLVSLISIGKTEDLSTSISASSPLVSSITISKTDDLSTSINVSSPLVSSISIGKTEDLLISSINVPSPSVSLAIISKTEDPLSSISVSSPSVYSATISKTEDLSTSFSMLSPLIPSISISKADDLSTSISASSPLVSSISIGKTEDLLSSFSVPSPSVSSATISKTEDHLSSISVSSASVSSATISKTEDLSISFIVLSPLIPSISISKTEDLSTSISASSPLVSSATIEKTADLLSSFSTSSLLISSAAISKVDNLSTSLSASSPLVSSIIISKTQDLLTSISMPSPLVTSTHSSERKSSSVNVTVTSLVDISELSSVVVVMKSSSRMLTSRDSAIFVQTTTALSTIQLVSPSPTQRSSVLATRVPSGSSSTTAIPNLSVTSDVIKPLSTPVPSQLPGTKQTATFSSNDYTVDPSSLLPTIASGISVLETSLTTGVYCITTNSEVVEVTHSVITLAKSLTSQLTDADTGKPTSRTRLTTQHLSTSTRNAMNYSTRITTGVPSISLVDTSAVWRSVRSMESSGRVAATTLSSPISDASSTVNSSIILAFISTLSTATMSGTSFATAHLSDLTSALSTIHSAAVTLSLDQRVSPMNSAQSLSIYETESLIKVSTSLSFQETKEYTSTQIWSTSTPTRDISVGRESSDIKTTSTSGMLLLTSPTIELSVKSSQHSPFEASNITTARVPSTVFSLSVTKSSQLQSLQTISTLPIYTTPSVTKSSLLQSLQTKSTMPNFITPSFIKSSLLQSLPTKSTTLYYSPFTITESILLQSLQTKSTMPHYITFSVTESSVLQSSRTKSTMQIFSIFSFIRPSLLQPLETTSAMPNYTASSVRKSRSLQSVQTKSTMLNYTTVSAVQQISTTSLALMHTAFSKHSTEETESVASQTVFTSSLLEVNLNSESLSLLSTKQAFSPSQAEKSPMMSMTLTRSADIVRTSSTVLPSILPSVGNVSAVTSTTSTVIPTSIGPTLVPSTDPTIPPNDNPVRLNDIGRLEAKVGKVFRYVIPRDIFYDREDGDTRNLTLSCNFLLLGVLPSDYWLQFDSKRQELYGLPLPLDYEKYSGKEEYERYVLTARDSQGLAARDVFQVVMIVVTDAVTQQLGIRTSNNYTVFTNNVTQRLDLVERVKTYYGDKDMSAIRIVSVTQGSLVVTWTNDTLPSDQCDKKAVQQISSKVILSDGEVNPAFRNALEPEFPIQNAKEERFGVCNDTETFPTVPARGQRSTSETDMWLKHVLPGILVALLLIILALILVVYLRRRRPKPSNPEKKTYKKRKPIVLGEEIEMKTVPAEPLILPDDNFSCPPSYLSETSLDKPQHYDTDDEDEVDFANKSPSIRYEPPPPFYPTYDSPRDTPPPSYKLPPPYKF